jgi:hypothetical protein
MTHAQLLRNLQAQLLAIHTQAMTTAQQCAALGTQVEATLHLLETESPPEPTEQVTGGDGVCQHPQEKRKDASTFGSKRFKCLACGVTVEG